MGLINKSYLVTLNQRVQGSSPCAPTKTACIAMVSCPKSVAVTRPYSVSAVCRQIAAGAFLVGLMAPEALLGRANAPAATAGRNHLADKPVDALDKPTFCDVEATSAFTSESGHVQRNSACPLCANSGHSSIMGHPGKCVAAGTGQGPAAADANRPVEQATDAKYIVSY